jgi:prevent-host-death family protein
MLDLAKDIQSLSHFKRNTAQVMKQMKKSGNPVVLTVNGKAEVVVQDAAAYQRLLALAEKAEMMESLLSPSPPTPLPSGARGVRKGNESDEHPRGSTADARTR